MFRSSFIKKRLLLGPQNPTRAPLCAPPGGGGDLCPPELERAGYRRLIAESRWHELASLPPPLPPPRFPWLLRSIALACGGLVVVLPRRGDLGCRSASAFVAVLGWAGSAARPAFC